MFKNLFPDFPNIDTGEGIPKYHGLAFNEVITQIKLSGGSEFEYY